MTVFRWLCWLRWGKYLIESPPAWSGPFAGATISGHDLKVHVPDGITPINDRGEFEALVGITQCEDCGHYSFGWRRA